MAGSIIARIRAWTFEQLDPRARHRPGLSAANRVLSVLILVATAMAILETEPTIELPNARLLTVLEAGLGVVFLIEYVARIWSAAEAPAHGLKWKGRLNFALKLPALIDLLTVIASFAPGVHGALVFRLFRLLRILRLAKLGRLSQAWSHMIGAVGARREELILSLMIGIGLMVGSATLLYLVEGAVQPDKFGSIPRALWWAVATLTTIGYGDVYPVTALGKVFASITALASIGLVAMPTGILAAAFSEAVQHHKATRTD
ncbi:MAG: ion transporter [Caulobacter sp.]|nr:ion transporter [Caulobacter sp.]